MTSPNVIPFPQRVDPGVAAAETFLARCGEVDLATFRAEHRQMAARLQGLLSWQVASLEAELAAFAQAHPDWVRLIADARSLADQLRDALQDAETDRATAEQEIDP